MPKNKFVKRAVVAQAKQTSNTKALKRKGNLYRDICSINNLRLADQKARKGKKNNYGIRRHDRHQEEHLQLLHEMMVNKTYTVGEYQLRTIWEPKERVIYRLAYYPHRIVQHAILNYLEPIFMAMFTANSYSCVKGKGIHGAFYDLKDALKDVDGTTYCLKLDIRKFYPSVDHDVLKGLLRRKFKDNDLLWLLDVIIDSADGLPIGNYLSQYLANFYLTGFDHWLKETKKIKHYFRYADDIVILASTKEELHQLLGEIRAYLAERLKLEVKGNYQIFPVEARGIDFVGYVFRHKYIRLRPSIKKRCARRLKKTKKPQVIAAYNGFLSHGNCRHLKKKLFHEKIQ